MNDKTGVAAIDEPSYAHGDSKAETMEEGFILDCIVGGWKVYLEHIVHLAPYRDIMTTPPPQAQKHHGVVKVHRPMLEVTHLRIFLASEHL